MKIGVVVIIVGVLVLLAVGVYLLVSQSATDIPSSNQQPNNNPSQENPAGGTFPEGTQPQTHQINIEDFAFSSQELTIQVGDTVRWTNLDSVVHTVTSDTGSELDSQNLGNNGVYSHTFNTVGTFDYHCTPHPSMKGRIIVE